MIGLLFANKLSSEKTMPDISPAETLQTALPGAIQEILEFRGDTTLIVSRDFIVDVCRCCHDTPGLVYTFCSGVTGVDYYPDEPRFALVYHLYSMLHNRSLHLKVFLPGDNPTITSVTSVYPAANWFEREAYDLLGITFEGHPDMRRILMPDGWDGHPLRKDYPLGYETVQFSFNFDDVNKHKPYAKD